MVRSWGNGLMIERSWVEFLAFPVTCSNSVQGVHTHMPLSVSLSPITKQYNLASAKEQWCSVAAKVTVGLVESMSAYCQVYDYSLEHSRFKSIRQFVLGNRLVLLKNRPFDSAAAFA